jgi:hypothetical protein
MTSVHLSLTGPIDENDNVTESWLCVDCGFNTAPGFPDGPTMRAQLAVTGKSDTYIDTDTEIYFVREVIWAKAGMKTWGGCLCIGCLEKRLGRRLRRKDFRGDPFTRFPCTPRLRDRRGR